MGDRELPGHVPVMVIGAGFAGVGAAAVLARAGHEVLVLERAPSVGGVWRDDACPGRGCDVESRLCSFSFAPGPGWARRFGSQPEILAYLRDVVHRFGLDARIRLGVELEEAAWDDDAHVWRLRTSTGPTTADVLVSACGGRSEPAVPELPGRQTFGGVVVHPARWTPGLDVAGRRVAVVGTGACAVQLVPGLARTASELTVFQRTPPWVVPRHDRAVPERVRRRDARHPLARRAARGWTYARRELLGLGLVHRPGLMRAVEHRGRVHLRRQVPDPGLRALLTPAYRAGCKRILRSDDYYPALSRHDVELVPSGVAALEPGTVVATDGTRRAADVVVLATGFRVTDPPVAHRLRGRDGRLLADVWRRTQMQALHGTTVHGFPNLFLLGGPDTGPGHASMIHVLESQLTYLCDALAALRRRGLTAMEPLADAQDAQDARDARARARLRRATRHVDLAEYRVTP